MISGYIFFLQMIKFVSLGLSEIPSVYMTCLHYLFICWWMPRLTACLHIMNSVVNIGKQAFMQYGWHYTQKWYTWLIWFKFHVLRNYYTNFYNIQSNLHSNKQWHCVSLPFSWHLPQHLLFFVFLMKVMLN